MNWKCGHCGEENIEHEADCIQCGWERRIVEIANPYHRIGTLEGAIKGALPHFEEAVTEWEYALTGSEMWKTTDVRQVIAKLKELIKEEQ